MLNKLTLERVKDALTAVAAAVVAIVGVIYSLQADFSGGNEPTARGVTNFDSLTLSDDLVVGDDTTLTDDATVGGDLTVTGALDVTGATTFGSGSLYPLLINDSSEAIYAASGTITGTLVLTASTHGLASITAGFCTLGSTPATGAGDPALCWLGFSGTTFTVTVEQDDWTTNASVPATVNYAVIGTP